MKKRELFIQFRTRAENNYQRGEYVNARINYLECLRLCRSGTIKYESILSCIDDMNDYIMNEAIQETDIINLRETLNEISDEKI